jgi:hypothetical protein
MPRLLSLETIIEIAEDKILADLCIKYFYETDEDKKKLIYDEIQEMYKKINDKN